MNLHCPHCGVKGSADDSYSGRTVKCPKCDGMFELTSDSTVDLSSGASSVLSTGSISLQCPECDVSGAADASYNGKSVRCPKCAAIFTAGEVGAAEVTAEATVYGAATSNETAMAAIVEEYVDEPVLADEHEVDVVEADSSELVESVSLSNQEVVPDPVGTVSDFEVPPGEITEGVEIEEPEEVAAVEEIEIVAAEQDEPFEILELDEEAAPPALEDKEMETELEQSLLPVEEEDLPETQIPPPVPDSIEVPAASIEQTPYGVDSEECWQCGKKDSTGQPFTTIEGRMYCVDCVPVEGVAGGEAPYEEPAAAAGFMGQEPGPDGVAADSQHDVPYNTFSIGEALHEAWSFTRGAKGTIWKGSVLMYLSILVVVAVGSFLLPSEGPGTPELTGWIGGAIFQAAGDAVSVLFTAGLLFMGIRRVAGDPIEWRMVFTGFSCAGKIIIATILQSILISVGILLLVLPGIYLAVGYAMALPLIVDRGMSPWEAMETSRKAIHKVWWKAAGLMLIMGLITIVSLIPLGIGLIWTWPMFIVLAGVVYRYLFGTGKSSG